MISSLLHWLQDTPLATVIGESWFPYVECVHVLFLATVAGTIFLVDTRLLWLTSRHVRFSYLSERLLPWTWTAFIGAAITGSMMFIANATHYASTTPFLIKMCLLVVAGLNMLYFQLVTFRTVNDWDEGRPVLSARVAGAISLLTWCGVIAFGRWTGFV